MDFIDRTEEMRRLEALRSRKEGALAVVTGRRRVGKTRLLVEWSRKHGGLYTVADQSAPEIQRRYFIEALSSQFPAFQDVSFPDWRALFRAVAREAARASWKGPLVIDELPFLVAASPELPSVLQHWLDHEAKTAGLVVALAGSSQRMMQGLVLDAAAPLYGRARELLEIRPLRLGYLADALELRDPISVVKTFAVWGGVPRYWELAEPYGDRVDEAVDHCALDPLGALHNEPDRLLLDEIPPAPGLRPILDAIGLGSHRLTEIAARIGQPVTSLGRPLARLMEMDLVCREVPFGETEKSGKRALYKMTDPFMAVWFKTVAPHRAFLAQATAAARRRLWERVRTTVYSSTWEALAREAVSSIDLRAGSRARRTLYAPAARFWRGGGPEWDLVSLSLDGKTLLLGEAKWSEKPFTNGELGRIAAELRAKGVPSLGVKPADVVRCLFVPRIAGHAHQIDGTFLFDAAAVVATLR